MDQSVQILGIPISRSPGSAVLDTISDRVEHGERVRVSYVNAHTLRLAARDKALKQALQTSDLVLNDGIGVELAARMRGEHFPENLNGSDFNARLLDLAASNHWRVYLLGAQPGICETAAKRAQHAHPGLEIAGTEHGFTGDEDANLAARISAAQADVLMVAMGNPKQEVWLEEHLESTGAKVGVAVGAFLDFTAGRVRRAPAWMNKLGIEWCYRLAQEPRRLAERYLVGIPIFLTKAWLSRRAEMAS